ncbi:cupredoxin domain-containing protein [Azospirillum doebereinerae]|uniref:Cupredoxin domain-containing protein n=1 Tax=Azospirillum doebereinerae TaxID=92933 RepID=A0A433J4Z3_9PROT|nr:cupredoxin domain-containing protein [Azospirillum doebereinerae]RUQ67499.1 cupredoxin domain-containing protein [Azospirillum doebereinerae]
MRRLLVPLAVSALALLPVAPALAEDAPITIVIKDHKFEPAEVKVPANKRVTLLVDNQDVTSEEFESAELKVEKIVGGRKQMKVAIGPLKPGKYPFFGEFHEATAQGVVLAE